MKSTKINETSKVELQMLEMKLLQSNKNLYDYPKIYVQVYCALLAGSETSGFFSSPSSTQDRAKADAIAKIAGVHTDAIVEYLMTNVSQEAQTATSQVLSDYFEEID